MRLLLAGALAIAGPAHADDYAKRGAIEIGASGGLAITPDIASAQLSPFVGWFVTDQLEVSAVFTVSHAEVMDTSATVWSTLVEPSYHVPIDPTTYWFLGMGIGAGYERLLGGAMIVAPRVGLNVRVGHSGILTPSLAFEYTTYEPALTSGVRLSIGYSRLW